MESESLDNLYKEYGRTMVQFEIIQSQLNSIKAKIAQEINKNNSHRNVSSTSEQSSNG